jgi:hypothetical protein
MLFVKYRKEEKKYKEENTKLPILLYLDITAVNILV